MLVGNAGDPAQYAPVHGSAATGHSTPLRQSRGEDHESTLRSRWGRSDATGQATIGQGVAVATPC